jgi:hypothetical protein
MTEIKRHDEEVRSIGQALEAKQVNVFEQQVPIRNIIHPDLILTKRDVCNSD